MDIKKQKIYDRLIKYNISTYDISNINMNKIIKCLYYADSISLYISCDDKTIEILKRLCLIASVQCDLITINNFYSNLLIVIKSIKDMNRIIPTIKQNFINEMYVDDDHVQQMKLFFEDIK